MTVWQHERLGRIVGVEVEQDEPSEWVFITLAHEIWAPRGFWASGEVMTGRRSSMTKATEDQEPNERGSDG